MSGANGWFDFDFFQQTDRFAFQAFDYKTMRLSDYLG